jgi:hypothetical protein
MKSFKILNTKGNPLLAPQPCCYVEVLRLGLRLSTANLRFKKSNSEASTSSGFP